MVWSMLTLVGRYPDPSSSSKWKLLVQGDPAMSTQQAMEMLYRKTQDEANGATERTGVGWVYDGVKVKHKEQ